MIRYVTVFDKVPYVFADISGQILTIRDIANLDNDGSELVPTLLQRWRLP
jgi:hypothetical protein